MHHELMSVADGNSLHMFRYWLQLRHITRRCRARSIGNPGMRAADRHNPGQRKRLLDIRVTYPTVEPGERVLWTVNAQNTRILAGRHGTNPVELRISRPDAQAIARRFARAVTGLHRCHHTTHSARGLQLLVRLNTAKSMSTWCFARVDIEQGAARHIWQLARHIMRECR